MIEICNLMTMIQDETSAFGSELKIYVGAVLERRKYGREKRVSVSRSHRDKRIGKCVCSVSI